MLKYIIIIFFFFTIYFQNTISTEWLSQTVWLYISIYPDASIAAAWDKSFSITKRLLFK